MATVTCENESSGAQIGKDGGQLWGPRVNLADLKDLYRPQQVKRFSDIPGNIDNLAMTTVDTILVRDLGEFTVVFRGYVRVARAHPTTDDWESSEVYTNMLDMQMHGEAEGLGPVDVRINPNVVCAGQIATPQICKTACLPMPAKNCRIATSVFFDVHKLGKTLFNKEPIMLCIDGITTMPPGGAHGYARFHNILPLYDLADPEGKPVAWLTRLEFDMGDYISDNEGEAYRKRREELMAKYGLN